ncbi:ubiquitin carboxyl-terminal hydrolase-like protein isozyme L3 [Pholiota molesta]|nr:ubiquitin carboxyl-terminal hydrolase-like protein isozyme L3 [Pholiota molesta]
MARKTFNVLENNPEVMNQLAAELGLAPALAFHDVCSLTEPALLGLVPRPAHALLVTIPLTPAWAHEREAEDAQRTAYASVGPAEPVLWFKQTIGNACGSIGLLHCLLNLPEEVRAACIAPETELARIRAAALPKTTRDRARVLEDSAAFEAAHERAVQLGQSAVPTYEEGYHMGNHFVAFLKGADGRLWELEGSRTGPLERGLLAPDEDVLSERALELGLRRVMEIGKADAGGDLRFSCTALGPAV